MNDAALMVDDDDDLVIVSHAVVDERGVSRLAIEWWDAFNIKLAAEREALEALEDRRSSANTERFLVARLRRARKKEIAA